MKSLLFAVLIFLLNITFAQSNLEEVVYLKNGGVIRGVIIEQTPNETIKIQTKDGSVFVYSISEVKKITKEVPYVNPSISQPIQTLEKPVQNNRDDVQTSPEIKDTAISSTKNSYTYNTPTDKKEYFKKGFIGITEIGTLFGNRSYDENNAAFSLNQLLGKRTSQHFSIGMAFGVDVNRLLVFVPVTLDTRIYFIKKRVTPFLNIAPGYALLKERNYNSYYYVKGQYYHSFISNFGLGVEFKVNKALGVSLNIGGRLTYIPAHHVDFIGGSGFFKFGIVY